MGYRHTIFTALGHRGFFNWLSDETYLKLAFYFIMHKKLHLENPQTFNEKLQWLKLFYRKEELTNLVDKYQVYDYVRKKIGEEHLIPLIGVWDNPKEINWDLLPQRFVLKCTHDSGGVFVVKNKDAVDKKNVLRLITKKLKINYFYGDREWPYKNVVPRIIAQEFLEEDDNNSLKDYKFFCFNGKPKFMFIAKDREKGPKKTKFNFYDMNFNFLQIKNGHENFTEQIKKPAQWDEMVDLASKLSKDLPHVRIDFFISHNVVYFGEMTFYHFSGMVPFEPEIWDDILGKEIVLPKREHGAK